MPISRRPLIRALALGAGGLALGGYATAAGAALAGQPALDARQVTSLRS